MGLGHVGGAMPNREKEVLAARLREKIQMAAVARAGDVSAGAGAGGRDPVWGTAAVRGVPAGAGAGAGAKKKAVKVDKKPPRKIGGGGAGGEDKET